MQQAYNIPYFASRERLYVLAPTSIYPLIEELGNFLLAQSKKKLYNVGSHLIFDSKGVDEVTFAIFGNHMTKYEGDFSLDKLVGKTFDLYITKLAFDGDQALDEFDELTPPYARLNILKDAMIIFTTERKGWTINPKLIENIFESYIDVDKN